MSLRIRRGTEAQRTGATFDLGEIVYATDTNKLYVGDGVNLGGKNILATSAGTGLIWNATTQRLDFNGSGTGIINLQADATPSLGGNLNLNNRNITGTGNINISGTVTATQLGGNLSTGSFNISGNGSISAGTISATTGLGANLSLNGRNITGTGNINITGTVTNTKTATPSIDGGTTGVSLTTDGSTPLSITGIGTLGPSSGQVYFNINAAKGTIASPTTSAAGGGLGGIAIQGYNGTDYKAASLIVASWDASATLSDTFPKSKLTLITGGGGSTLRQATLDNQGVFTAPILKAGSYSTTEMNAIVSPSAGMIIFNTTASDFYGYNGSAWVAFTGP